MNENLNLVEILKDCPKGTKLYSLVNGEVYLYAIDEHSICPIILKCGEDLVSYSVSGKCIFGYRGECVLFPSKEQRDWRKFKVKKLKFDPKTLQAFDKVLVRDKDDENWNCGFFSHKDIQYKHSYRCIGTPYIYCIPYNDDTKHLVGTSNEAPEYYRYWED